MAERMTVGDAINTMATFVSYAVTHAIMRGMYGVAYLILSRWAFIMQILFHDQEHVQCPS